MNTPRTGYAYLDEVLDQPGAVIAMAHRGGAEHPDLRGLENTRHAFEHAVALGYRYLETDVHATRDGTLLAFHDDSLDRVTDSAGAVAEMLATEVAVARIGDAHAVPPLAELFEAFPNCRFNIDLKADTAVEPLVALLNATGRHDAVGVGSFSLARLNRFRRLTDGRVATSAAPAEVVAFKTLPAPLARRTTGGRVAVLQVPHRRGRLVVVDAPFVRRAQAAGAQVHVWTVDDPAEMDHLLDLGVDGLITDRTDLLKDVLVRRGQWRDFA